MFAESAGLVGRCGGALEQESGVSSAVVPFSSDVVLLSLPHHGVGDHF